MVSVDQLRYKEVETEGVTFSKMELERDVGRQKLQGRIQKKRVTVFEDRRQMPPTKGKQKDKNQNEGLVGSWQHVQ